MVRDVCPLQYPSALLAQTLSKVVNPTNPYYTELGYRAGSIGNTKAELAFGSNKKSKGTPRTQLRLGRPVGQSERIRKLERAYDEKQRKDFEKVQNALRRAQKQFARYHQSSGQCPTHKAALNMRRFTSHKRASLPGPIHSREQDRASSAIAATTEQQSDTSAESRNAKRSHLHWIHSPSTGFSKDSEKLKAFVTGHHDFLINIKRLRDNVKSFQTANMAQLFDYIESKAFTSS